MAKELTALRLDADLLAALREVKAREGIPVTAQIEFAIRAWLKARARQDKRDRKEHEL